MTTSKALSDLIVSQTGPIIESMESRFPEETIARAVEGRTMTLIREALLNDSEVVAAVEVARTRYGQWDYLQTLGSAVSRDEARESAAQVIGQRIAAMLDIDLEDLLRSQP